MVCTAFFLRIFETWALLYIGIFGMKCKARGAE